MKKKFLKILKLLLKAMVILFNIVGAILIIGTIGYMENGGDVTLWQWLSVALMLVVYCLETLEVKE